MEKFAKLFDVEDRQLIVYIEYSEDADGDEDKYTLHQITDLGFGMMDLSLGGPQAAMRRVFAEYEQATAENFFKIDIVKQAMGLKAEDV